MKIIKEAENKHDKEYYQTNFGNILELGQDYLDYLDKSSDEQDWAISVIDDLVLNHPSIAKKINDNKYCLANIKSFFDKCKVDYRPSSIPMNWITPAFFAVEDNDSFNYRFNLMSLLANDFYDYFNKKLNQDETAKQILFKDDGQYRPIGYKDKSEGSTWDMVEKIQTQSSTNNYDDEDTTDEITPFIRLLSGSTFNALRKKLHIEWEDVPRWVQATFNDTDIDEVEDLVDAANGKNISGVSPAIRKLFNELKKLYNNMTQKECNLLIDEIQDRFV